MRDLLHQKTFDLIDQNKCRYFIGEFGDINMTLPTGTKRHIGQLMKGEEGNIIYVCFRKKQFHLMRVNNSYGVNEFIMKQFAPDIILFQVEDTGERLKITKKDFDAHSEYMHFKQQGFELQKFIGLTHLEAI
jgi:hypothetical protein